ncbi:hypothetical protein [Mangrovivirga cuniculi]|uniref:TonB C-terminal domain-containing protein n=1 Tax=Mangrovivirga cuniculi TaxID=2715131 RepID=A0A4D7K924_9BACT|nr:hypothetical protein [Mangrovivirga cuniculi]QCK15798.1 hypothetical protein DCC35_14110 [Mangrovivirga cuniculi]
MKYIFFILLGLSFYHTNAQFASSYSNGQPDIKTEFPYNKAVVKGKRPNAKEKKSGKYKYFNELGELIRIETYKKGELISYKTIRPQAYYYDKDSNLIEFHRYDVFGFCASSSGDFFGTGGPKDCIEKYIYDKKGNLLEEQFFSKKNQLLNDPYNPAIIKYEYNSKGKLIKKSQLNDRRELLEDIVEMAYTTYIYDSLGNLIETNSYNSKGELSGSFYGASTIKRIYDNDNNMVEKRLLKPDGSLAGLDMAGAPIEKYRYNEKNLEIYSSGWTSETNKLGHFILEYGSDDLLKYRTYYGAKDSVNYFSKTEYIYKDGVVVGKKSYDKSGEIKSENYSKIEIEIEGWEVEGNLPDINKLDAFGTIEFVFQVDVEGNVIGYSLTKRAGGKSYMDFCQDTLNNLKFRRIDDSENLTGKITFNKI